MSNVLGKSITQSTIVCYSCFGECQQILYLRCGVIEVMYTPLLLCMHCMYYRGVSPVSSKPYTSVSEEVKHG